MSTSLGSQENQAEEMDRRQEASDRSLRAMLADEPCEMTFEVTPAFRAELEQLMCDTRQNLEDVFTKAIALYKAAVASKREGKHVGVADEAEKLESEFVGLGSPSSGL
jgi:hypothetical protein